MVTDISQGELKQKLDHPRKIVLVDALPASIRNIPLTVRVVRTTHGGVPVIYHASAVPSRWYLY